MLTYTNFVDLTVWSRTTCTKMNFTSVWRRTESLQTDRGAGPDRNRAAWTRLDWTGLDWTGPVSAGQWKDKLNSLGFFFFLRCFYLERLFDL